MSEPYQHQHGHGHGHGAHGAQSPGGEGQNGGGIFGFQKDGHGHNFLSHLLGLDHEAHIATAHGLGAHGHAHGQITGHGGVQSPSGSASWTSALRSVKLSDALQGVTITPPMLFMLLFASFIGWLFVVYWVRHHEPLANSVLGTGAAQSATAAADRQILSKTKWSMPARTSEETGDVYVPMPVGSMAANASSAVSMPLPAPPVPPPPAPDPQPVPLTYGGLPAISPFSTNFGQPKQASAYLVPEPEAVGTRVKMIVNR